MMMGAERSILLAGLGADLARDVAAHATAIDAAVAVIASGSSIVSGAAVATGDEGVILVPAEDFIDIAGYGADAAIVAVGRGLDALQQADALARGAFDVVDLAWAPALVQRRLAQAVDYRQLQKQIAAELAKKQRELNDARALQLAMVPKPLAVEQLAVDVVLEPAMELGGDLVDYVVLADGRCVLALGDVSGKGAAAALTMARTHTLLRSLALRAYAGDLLSPPNTAARRLNGMLAIENDGCMFVTFFLGLLDPVSGELAYVRCGQIPPFLRRRDGAVERLDAVGGLPLGVMEGVDYAVGYAQLGPGDSLLIISDGVSEAEAPDGALFGEDPVLDWLKAPREELGSLVGLARRHEQGRPPSDDLSALLVRRR
jgi:sigma-B regulation protein RsbU (phosphoserine phosphatase)